jgi:hypothetical protein
MPDRYYWPCVRLFGPLDSVNAKAGWISYRDWFLQQNNPSDFFDRILEKLCSILLIISQDPTNLPLSSLIAATETPLIPLHRGFNQKKSVEPLVDEIWAMTLPKSPSVPLDQPYFEIWGDGIAAIQFIGAYASRGFNLEIEDIFEHPTNALNVFSALEFSQLPRIGQKSQHQSVFARTQAHQ